MTEIELATRLFHSANLDELMACLNEHPTRREANCPPPQAGEAAAVPETRSRGPNDVEVPANSTAATCQRAVHSS